MKYVKAKQMISGFQLQEHVKINFGIYACKTFGKWDNNNLLMSVVISRVRIINSVLLYHVANFGKNDFLFQGKKELLQR